MRCGGFRVLTLVVLVAFCPVLCGCRRGTGDATNVVGSTSVQPFAELLAQEYTKQDPNQTVNVQGGGSTAGIQSVANRLAEIGMCSRSLTAEEATQFTPITIARDGLAIVVNPENPVRELSVRQLREIFSGRATSWREFGGEDRAIHAITREEGSGTRESFVHLVMGKDRIASRALVQESNGAVRELVRGDPAAIGYMSLGLVHKDLKSVVVDGAEPTAGNVLAGKYKLARPFQFVTRGTPSAKAQKFIDFVLSADSQRILEREGLIRAK